MITTFMLTAVPAYTQLIASAATFSAPRSSFSASGTSVTFSEEDERTPVKMEDLPTEVKQALEAPEFYGWTAVMAWWVREEKASFYEIDFAKGTEKKVVRLNEKGNRMI